MKTTATLFVLSIFLVPLLLSQTKPLVLVAYYSERGHTKAMAEAVAEGVKSEPDVTVLLRTVADATTEEVLAADAIIVGSPVFNAAVAPPVQQFINSWPFEESRMKDKIGAAFATGGGISAGEELVQLSILHSMLVFGMIVAGGPEWQSPFGASGITESPNDSQNETIRPEFIRKGRLLGKRIAALALRMRSEKR